ncbi:MAG: hypothetical protein M3Y56_11555 [Armatimonadota bacterium]|nr:hypothetical protein [Armatimonadota bacterium]
MAELLEIVLANSNLRVEPGGTAEVEVLVRNHGAAADSAALEVEFAHPEWVAIPVAGLAVGPQETRPVRVLFKVPRNPTSPAGDYPFVIRARSLETGASSTAQGALHVQPYHVFSLGLNPLRTFTRPMQGPVQYLLRLENGGNTPEVYDLSITDSENNCVYGMPAERVEVRPGEVVEVPLSVQPRRRPPIAPPGLYAFQVKADPVSHGISSESAHGQLEFRAFCTPFVAFVAALAACYAGYWFWQRSQAPVIEEFRASPASSVAGNPVKLEYAVKNASTLLYKDEKNVLHALDRDSVSTIVEPIQTTTYTLIARDDRGLEDTKDVKVTVEQGAPLPPPMISLFQARPTTINSGHPTVLTWKVANAQTLMLAPLDKQIDPALPSLEVSPTQTVTYTLVAKNSSGTASRSASVTVIPAPDPSAPKVAMFSVTPAVVHEGQPVTLSWDVTGAASVLVSGFGPVETQGSRTFQAERTTRFTLTASSPSGAQTGGQADVTVLPPPVVLLFEARPLTIKSGGKAMLLWKVQNADNVSIEGLGPVGPIGSREVSPEKTTTYTLTVGDTAGHSVPATATVIVGEKEIPVKPVVKPALRL